MTGLLAGGASCAAVQGGLLASAVARRRSQLAPAIVGGNKTSKAKRRSPRQQDSAPPQRTSALEDGVPVGSFLLGKLTTHTALGAMLGLLGDAVALSVKTRAFVQIGSGFIMVLLALDLFGVQAVRALVPTPPASWGRRVRRNTRLSSVFGPAILGGSTVLIPCGITIGMEFMAIASGSALTGAAIMATFVIGTSPLFAAIGYAARRSTVLLRGRLSVLAAAAVMLAGLVSINTGLVLADSRYTFANARRALAGSQGSNTQAAKPVPPPGADGVQRVALSATNGGYSPSVIQARAGIPTSLTVQTNNVQGCTRAFVIPSTGLQEYLPESGNTTFDLGTLQPGSIRFTCAMGMYSGSIEVVA